MATMDLTVKEVMGVQKKYETECGDPVLTLQESFKETDITGDNHFSNSKKTETSSDYAHNPSTLFQVKSEKDKVFEVGNSLFSYSSFKKAMDLRVHNRTVDGGKRTIFEDAEYFSRNCCYKLLPITFEQVDEAIIHTEHNYSLFSVNSESEPEEDCSRTMDYSQIREKNYKKRRTKSAQSSDQEEVDVDGGPEDDFAVEENPQLEQENPFAGQPLDLSVGTVVQEEKTETLPRDHLTSIGEEAAQADSDKENVSGELSGIRVTITRPDEKENYQPCDLFLNDIARLVPWLIDKDCLEVDILDRTCDRHEEFRKHRLYYVIAESTWRSFQTANERVILTNDQSLGQPLRKVEWNERPSYLVFDQFSLAKCLAEYCQEIGGCFEYTCFEEGGEGGLVQEKLDTPEEGEKGFAGVTGEREVKAEVEKVEGEQEKEEVEEVLRVKGVSGGLSEVETGEAYEGSVLEGRKKEGKEEGREKGKKGEGAREENGEQGAKGEKAEDRGKRDKREPREKRDNKGGVREKGESRFDGKECCENVREREQVLITEVALRKEVSGERGKKIQEKGSKGKRKPPTQPKPKNCQISTRSKSTSESVTSQKSDKRVEKKQERKRRAITPPKEELPNKRRKTVKASEMARRKPVPLPPEVRTGKTRKGPEKKQNEARKEGGRKERREQERKENGMQKEGVKVRAVLGKGEERRGSVQATERSLRSRGGTGKMKEVKGSSKKGRSR